MNLESIDGEIELENGRTTTGNLVLTNHRLLMFLSDDHLVSIPIGAIDELSRNYHSLSIYTKQCRLFIINFDSVPECTAWFKRLSDAMANLKSVEDLFAFQYFESSDQDQALLSPKESEESGQTFSRCSISVDDGAVIMRKDDSNSEIDSQELDQGSNAGGNAEADLSESFNRAVMVDIQDDDDDDGIENRRPIHSTPTAKSAPANSVQLPSHKSVNPLEDQTFPEPKRYKPCCRINLNSWSRPKPDKFLKGAKYRSKVKSKNRKNAELDEALTELEEIYASLNLDGDEDLLDRAERRDLPCKFQLMRFHSEPGPDQNRTNHLNYSSYLKSGSSRGKLCRKSETKKHQQQKFPSSSLDIEKSPERSAVPERRSIYEPPTETGWKHPYCEHFISTRNLSRSLGDVQSLLSSCEPPYRDKAPPRRRSAVPDPVADDLAQRKMVKTRSPPLDNNEKRNFVEDKKIQSYLLISPIYNPTARDNVTNSATLNTEPINTDYSYLSSEPEPDIEKDDLSYRKVIQSDAASILPPQPPFGIPNGITKLSTENNYIEAKLSEKDRNFYYYRVKPYYPHLIKDDMAFRSFRKDLTRKSGHSEDATSSPWSEGIKFFPVTTNHLIQQRNESRAPKNTLSPINHTNLPSTNLLINNNNDYSSYNHNIRNNNNTNHKRPASFNSPHHYPYYKQPPNYQYHLHQHHGYHQQPSRVSLIASGFEYRSSLV